MAGGRPSGRQDERADPPAASSPDRGEDPPGGMTGSPRDGPNRRGSGRHAGRAFSVLTDEELVRGLVHIPVGVLQDLLDFLAGMAGAESGEHVNRLARRHSTLAATSTRLPPRRHDLSADGCDEIEPLAAADGFAGRQGHPPDRRSGALPSLAPWVGEGGDTHSPCEGSAKASFSRRVTEGMVSPARRLLKNLGTPKSGPRSRKGQCPRQRVR